MSDSIVIRENGETKARKKKLKRGILVVLISVIYLDYVSSFGPEL
jgi:hypothetical protein